MRTNIGQFCMGIAADFNAMRHSVVLCQAKVSAAATGERSPRRSPSKWWSAAACQVQCQPDKGSSWCNCFRSDRCCTVA